MTKKRLTPHRNYEIGYGKPPKNTRFRKGQSGNPLGRPRGSKNKSSKAGGEQLKEIILEEAYRTIAVNEESGPITIPMMQAILRAVTVKAAKGDHRSQKLVVDMVAEIEAEQKAVQEYILSEALSYIREADEEIERRKRENVSGPEILPHPDDVRICEITGAVDVIGPVTVSERREFEKEYVARQNLCGLLEEIESQMNEKTGKEERNDLEERRNTIRRVIGKLTENFADGAPVRSIKSPTKLGPKGVGMMSQNNDVGIPTTSFHPTCAGSMQS